MRANHRIVAFAFVVFAMVATASSTAVAEDDDVAEADTAIESGSHALSFSFPTGGAGWGIPGARQAGDDGFFDFDRGLAEVASFSSIAYWIGIADAVRLGIVGALYTDEDYGALGLAPSIKYYLATDQSVTPYLYGSLGFWAGDDVHPGLGAGLGVEYFPVRQVSVGGRVGLTVDTFGPDDTMRIWTGTSGLDVNFYF